MSSTTSFTSVPIVDISGLRSPDDAERARVAAEIGTAARDVGFLYVSGSGIDEALFELVRNERARAVARFVPLRHYRCAGPYNCVNSFFFGPA